MDFQRFDLEQRRISQKPLPLSLAPTEADIWDKIHTAPLKWPVEFLDEPDTWDESLTPELSLSDDSETNSVAPPSITPSTSTLVTESPSFTDSNQFTVSDIFDREDFIIERTIIRPVQSPSKISKIFPRRSFDRLMFRPKSLPNLKSRDHRPQGHLSSFEEEVEFLQHDRERHNQTGGVRIRVDTSRSIHVEERWREAIHRLLYGRMPVSDSVAGYVEVC